MKGRLLNVFSVRRQVKWGQGESRREQLPLPPAYYDEAVSLMDTLLVVSVRVTE